MIKLSTFCMESSTRLFNDIFLDVEHQMCNIISCMKDEYMWTFFGERIYRNACVTLFLHMCGKTPSNLQGMSSSLDSRSVQPPGSMWPWMRASSFQQPGRRSASRIVVSKVDVSRYFKLASCFFLRIYIFNVQREREREGERERDRLIDRQIDTQIDGANIK